MPVSFVPTKREIKYFITHCRRQEIALRVWDIKTMDCVAAYKMEGNVSTMYSCFILETVRLALYVL